MTVAQGRFGPHGGYRCCTTIHSEIQRTRVCAPPVGGRFVIRLGSQSLLPISLGAGLRTEQLCFADLVSIASDRLFAHDNPARRGQLLDLHPVELDVVTGLGGAYHEG